MYNKAILVGRLTADPEIKQTQNGVFVTSFTIACDRSQKDKVTDFINIVCWRERAEFVSRYFHKGDPIGIDGSIQTRKYKDKQGNDRTAVEIVADKCFFVASKASNEPKKEPVEEGFTEVDDNDIPF